MSKVNKIKIGRYVKQSKGYSAFTPNAFPPQEGFELSAKLHKKHEEALRLVGKLDGITQLLPDKDFFLLMFIKKDATYSSQIEGTKATFQDAVAASVEGEKPKLNIDVDDITHYVEAINYGIKRIKDLPISLRLIKEIHKKLMVGARSTHYAYPGEFRTTQNWIGGKTLSDASFIPPAPNDLITCLSDLERFIHSKDNYPFLIKAGLVHAQFETIHPFVDGNGRVGRMLIALYLHHIGLLELPVLYLSSYFKKHQKLYYQRLSEYHGEGYGVEEWLIFFLEGVAEIAQASIETCAKITALRDRDFSAALKLGKASAESTLEIVRKLFNQPIVGIAEIMNWTGFSKQGAYNVIQRLMNLRILEPLGDQIYGQKYVYADYYEIFDESYKERRHKKGK